MKSKKLTLPFNQLVSVPYSYEHRKTFETDMRTPVLEAYNQYQCFYFYVQFDIKTDVINFEIITK